MGRYRRIPVEVDAVQVNDFGQHPEHTFEPVSEMAWSDRRLRHGQPCEKCGRHRHEHRLMQTVSGWNLVCRGDWLVTMAPGDTYPVSAKLFREIYEEVPA